MTELKKAESRDDFQIIETLARQIMPEVYEGIVPQFHVTFFLDTFQTVAAIEQQVTKESYHYYLLCLNDEAGGYLGIQLKDDCVNLSKIYILPDFRGKKLGKMALDFVDKEAERTGINKIELIVNQKNEVTIGIYKKAGYVITESLTHTYDNGHSEYDYRMEKMIT